MSTRYSQADLDALNAAIATGAKSVSYNGQRVDYRDLAEMKSVPGIHMHRDKQGRLRAVPWATQPDRIGILRPNRPRHRSTA